MLRIRDLLDYFQNEGLTFNQVMELYLQGKVKIPSGEFSREDLTTLYSELGLEPVDMRSVSLDIEMTIEDAVETSRSPGDVTARINAREKEHYELTRAYKKSRGNGSDPRRKIASDLFDKNIELAVLYEERAQMTGSTGYSDINSSMRYRRLATEVFSDPKSIAEKRKLADNLLRLGELEMKEKIFSAQDNIVAARDLYEEVLSNIRNVESRTRAEENAKIGLVSLLLYRFTKDPQMLEDADKRITPYFGNGAHPTYQTAVLEIIRLKQEAEEL